MHTSDIFCFVGPDSDENLHGPLRIKIAREGEDFGALIGATEPDVAAHFIAAVGMELEIKFLDELDSQWLEDDGDHVPVALLRTVADIEVLLGARESENQDELHALLIQVPRPFG